MVSMTDFLSNPFRVNHFYWLLETKGVPRQVGVMYLSPLGTIFSSLTPKGLHISDRGNAPTYNN